MATLPTTYDMLINTIIEASEGKPLVVGISGGVDSAVVLHAALSALPHESVIAAHFQTPLGSTDDLIEAYAVARHCGAQLHKILLDPLSVTEVATNALDRCYHCKHKLFSQLKRLFHDHCILDGSHAGDDPKRPGLRALKELGITSPLREAGLKKSDIRTLAHALSIPTAQRPSAPCLATRFPYNTPLNLQSIKRVEQAESLMRALDFKRFRVRHEGDSAIRLELFDDELIELRSKQELVIQCLQGLGWASVVVDETGYHQT